MVSDELKNDVSAMVREKFAKDMGHSVATQQKWYNVLPAAGKVERQQSV